MKTKNTIFLLIIAAVVFGAIFYMNQKEEETLSTAAIPVKNLPALTSGTVERISVAAPGEKPVTLTRSNGTWYTNVEKKYEADQAAVSGIFSTLSEPIEANVVSTNEDSFAEYHVTETSGTHVQIFEPGKEAAVLDMVIGKDGSSAFSTYIRMKDGKEVLNARVGLSMIFKRPDGWRDKQIFQFSGSNATRVAADGTSSTFTAAKTEEGTWQFAAPTTGTVEQARITSLANMLSNLRANDFVEPADEQTLADFGLEPPRQTLSLSYEDKSTSPSTETSVTLHIGKESNTPGDWYARRGDKNDVFTIGQYIADALAPDPATLKAQEPEPEPTPELTPADEATTPVEAAEATPAASDVTSTAPDDTAATPASTPEPTPAATPEPTPAPTPTPAVQTDNTTAPQPS